jgi:hypothetical protein
MNPSVYQREVERIESETSRCLHLGKHGRPATFGHRDYVREQLPSGCILYRMILPAIFGSQARL